MFLIDNNERLSISCGNGGLSTDSEVTSKKTTLQLLQQMKPDVSWGPDYIHYEIRAGCNRWTPVDTIWYVFVGVKTARSLKGRDIQSTIKQAKET